MTLQLYPGAASRIVTAGDSIPALYGPMIGGFIWNPNTPLDQGTPTMEVLYVDITGPAALKVTNTTVVLQPGQYFRVPWGQNNNVWVNAKTNGHSFTAVTFQPSPDFPPRPTGGNFPPLGPTGLTETISSYLYEQYTNDDDLQGFVMSYNELAQEYVDWFNNVNLPVYTGDPISGGLLDWVAQGLYGIQRKPLSTGQRHWIGPINAFMPNQIAINKSIYTGPTSVTAMSDDVFKRVITWHFYKGDGKYLNVQWLKRRIYRFLYGVNGTDADGSTNQISISFGPSNQINITLITGIRTFVAGCVPNAFVPNGIGSVPNLSITKFTPIPAPLMAETFKEAVQDGILEMPFQYQTVVNIGA